jgi:FAD/FMN-containing dehydrogenase
VPTKENAMTQISSAAPIAIADLRGQLSGSVIGPDDPGYDKARVVMYGEPVRPAVIVRAANVSDVQRVIALARETGLELAVRGGGHSSAGHGSTDGGIVLDLGPMKAVDIDVAGRTVWADGGLTALELTTEVGKHGLVIGFGDTGSVGIGGITTGGGVGFLVRRFGLTIDNLIAADVVTADGELVRTDAGHEPDLFWAIRGGGGNFGVVTRFQFRLHALPAVVGGMLLLPATAETVAGFMALSADAPEELSAIANVMPAPPMPFVPVEVHGKLVIMALMAWAGDAVSAAPVLAPFRALAKPIADLLRPMAYGEMFPPEDPDYHPIAAARTMFIDHVDEATGRLIVDRLEEHVRSTNAQMAVVQLRALGGAMARVPVEATAFAHRRNPIMVNIAALVEDRDDLAEHLPWVARLAADLDQGVDGAYVNFIADEGEERVHAAYPGSTWDRLVAIKERYDSTNLFHRNQNIPPG